jgi:hypothetical protein
MKKFLINLFILTFSVVLLSFLSDWGIKAYFFYFNKRNKPDVQNINADVVFFGSSRCIHSIIPSRFDSITKYSSFNMGWSASNPREIYAAIKIYLTQNRMPKFICIQIDCDNNILEEDELAKQSLLKYYNRGLIDEYFSNDLAKILNIPLRASEVNRDFGWREILKSFFNNGKNLYLNNGYIPLLENRTIAQKDLIISVNDINTLNPWILAAINACNEKNIQTVLFTSPYFNSKNFNNFNFFNRYGITYWNFANSLKNPDLFSDNAHTNHEGAIQFTDTLSRKFIAKFPSY